MSASRCPHTHDPDARWHGCEHIVHKTAMAYRYASHRALARMRKGDSPCARSTRASRLILPPRPLPREAFACRESQPLG
eukprot:3512123-Prymnesium_polylepis.1